MNNVNAPKSRDQEIFECIRDSGIFNITIDASKQNHHFEEVIECIEQWKIQDEKRRFDEDNNSLDTSSTNSDVKSAKYEARRVKRALFDDLQKYNITLVPDKNMPSNTGKITVLWTGVDIYYPAPSIDNDDAIHLQNHITICHELSHVLLDCPSFYFDRHNTEKWVDDARNGNYDPRFYDKDEVAASRGAEWILSSIAKKCEEAGIHTPSYLRAQPETLFDGIITVMSAHGYKGDMPPYDLVRYSIADDNAPVDRTKIP